jgi:hypothetical protein
MDNVVLLNGFRLEPDLDGDPLLSIEAINKLHNRLMELVIIQTPYLSGPCMRWLRTEMHMDRLQLSRAIGIAEATIIDCELRDAPTTEALERALRYLACDVFSLPSYRGTWVLDCENRLPYRFELQLEKSDWIGRVAFNGS